jgi:hypothetical protein
MNQICKAAFLVIAFFACRSVFGQNAHVIPGGEGLVLVAATRDGLVLATDSAMRNADATLSLSPKILPSGQYAAVLIAGAVSIQDPIDRPVREEINIARIAAAWLDSHHDADPHAAAIAIQAGVGEAMTAFFSTRDPGKQHGQYKFTVISVGFTYGKPQVIATKFFMPVALGKAARTESTSSEGNPGDIWVFGGSKVEQELVRGTASVLKAYKVAPSVQQFRGGHPENMSAQDFLDLFGIILQAAESEEGKNLEGDRPVIGPPNRFATITLKDGFIMQSR